MTAGDAKREHDVRLVRLERSLVPGCQAEATGVILKVRAELHVLPGKRNFSLTAYAGVDAKNTIYG